MSRIEVVAPIAGNFSNHPDDESTPYVGAGSTVHVGTVVGRVVDGIHSVEVEAEVAGVVRELAVGDGDVVVIGQALVIIDTH